MPRLRIALVVASVVGFLTLLVGILYDARPLTILYRGGISFLLFGFLSYLLGGIVEQFLGDLLRRQKEKGRKIDLVSEPESASGPNATEDFVPFTPEKLERVSQVQE